VDGAWLKLDGAVVALILRNASDVILFSEHCWCMFSIPVFHECVLHILSGWWFQTFFMVHNIWDVILPIDELHHFSEGFSHHQPVVHEWSIEDGPNL